MKTVLENLLRRIDGRGYKAYKEIQGEYDWGWMRLYIDHVQGDPFAAPSKVRIRLPMSVAQLPADLFGNRVRRIALEDFLARQVRQNIARIVKDVRGSGKSGVVRIDAGGQEVLERTAVRLTADWVEARLEVGLPAAGRTVLGHQARRLLCEYLPQLAENSLQARNLSISEARQFVDCVENHHHLQFQLKQQNLVAFVADGAILPRESGISDRPMAAEQAVAFRSPESLRVTLPLKNPVAPFGETISGMGIPAGITLIVGGGYHGKSTLLEALELGVYPHVPGDGREYVVTNPAAVKIRAEDGRRVTNVNLRPFIQYLPRRGDVTRFTTDDASGSTSQAANILEALEMGAQLLLIDEDTSATNFMIRDARMQALVHREDEPITPFLDRVRELYRNFGVSTILVMGGSGDYFDVADTVIMMKEYLPREVTEQARQISRQYITHRQQEVPEPFRQVTERIPVAGSFDPSRGKREVKIDAKGLETILFGTTPIDLRYLEQLVDVSQTRAIGYAIHLANRLWMDGQRSLSRILDELEVYLDDQGVDALDPFRRGERHPGNFARPRRFEIGAAINRLRTLRMKQK